MSPLSKLLLPSSLLSRVPRARREKVSRPAATARLEESQNYASSSSREESEFPRASRVSAEKNESSFPAHSSSPSCPLFVESWKCKDVSALFPSKSQSRVHHRDQGFSLSNFVTQTFNMPKSKKNNKSGQPSTASQGKPSSRSTAFDGDSDSSVSFVEDVYDSYEPPKTRGSKGAKASKHKTGMKAQDFLKNPNSNFLAVKIKQEPVSPKAGDSMAARNPQGVSGSHAATTSASRCVSPLAPISIYLVT